MAAEHLLFPRWQPRYKGVLLGTTVRTQGAFVVFLLVAVG
jgi:hypothetical protein